MKEQLEASQLTRRAFVYVRQSTMAQVLHHQESTMMQYDLRQRALALGWAPEAIEVIDEDQARSATTTDGRSGFGYMARAVAHGEAGAVFAVDVSRMARASEDFRRLLGLCAYTTGQPLAVRSGHRPRASSVHGPHATRDGGDAQANYMHAHIYDLWEPSAWNPHCVGRRPKEQKVRDRPPTVTTTRGDHGAAFQH